MQRLTFNRSYISELLGQPKPKENLKDFLSASSVLSLKLGRVDVRFHEPWSLKTFVAEQRARVESSPPSPSLRDPQSSESRIRLLRTLGFKVLSDVNAVSVVMPTALVGTVLLTLRGRGVNKREFVRRVEWLSDRVRDKGGRVAHFAGAPTEVVVERALEVLGPEMIGTIDDLPETVHYAVDRFQLSFYRNMTIHLFISEALVSAAMYTRVKLGGGPDIQRISFDALYDQVYFLSQASLCPTRLCMNGQSTNKRRSFAASSSTPQQACSPISIKLCKASRQIISSSSLVIMLMES